MTTGAVPDLTRKAISLRLPATMLSLWQDEHARTYELHRMSFNTWLISRVQLSFGIQDEAVNPPVLFASTGSGSPTSKETRR